MSRRQFTHVQALGDGDARIGRDPGVKLTMAHIEGYDFGSTARQQHLGKPAGRGADIKTDQPLRRQREIVECGCSSAHRATHRDGAVHNRSARPRSIVATV